MMTVKDEWIVEQIVKGERPVTRVIGKVIFAEPKETLSVEELESIWCTCNYGPAQLRCKIFMSANLPFANDFSVYDGMGSYGADGLWLVPMCNAPAYVNDDIFIRKHYEPLNGYWINNGHRTKKDEWIFTHKQAFLKYFASR